MDITFEPGRSYYLRDGRKVTYLAATTDGNHVVAPILEFQTYDGYETADGPAEFHQDLFEKAPREVRDEEVAALEAEVVELERRQSEKLREVIDEERTIKDRLAKLKKYRGLERIEEFIEGRITHVVIESYAKEIYEVHSFDEKMHQLDSRGRSEGLKLVSLLGKTNGDLQWRVNDYYDGSGSWKAMYPCASAEEADAKRRDLIAEGLATHWATYKPNSPYHFLKFVAAALEVGVPVTAEQKAVWDVARQAETAKKRQNLLEKIEHLKGELNAI